ncbi:MAG TPA: phosphoenolpyruvate carboxylase [Anaeromyxobacter sp.]|nr:phosphoenolpyruvate carboxylase [Anaeromyxobacter sp.]
MASPREPAGSDQLDRDVRLLGEMLGGAISRLDGTEAFELIEALRALSMAVRRRDPGADRATLAARMRALDAVDLARVANAFTDLFHLVNAAEEQQRIRVLRARDAGGASPPGGVADACARLRRDGATADDVRSLLRRLLVMPVVTAHPTEARRRAVLHHLGEISELLDRLDDPRAGAGRAEELHERLREAITALSATAKSRRRAPTPLDEVDAGLRFFERTLLEVTPAVYRALERALAATWPGEAFEVPAFLRFGSWIGGDRDGNPHVTAAVTRATLERHRAIALQRCRADVAGLWRALSLAEERIGGSEAARRALAELRASTEADRRDHPGLVARVAPEGEPWREKVRYVAARLAAAEGRGAWGYADAREYVEDLRLLERTLDAVGLSALARGRLRDCRRRAEVFGFHVASLDLRQHSAVHEQVVDELLARGGLPGYASRDEPERVALLSRVLGHDDLAVRDPRGLSPAARDLLATLETAGWARRDMGAAACERYVVSFTRSASDLLEVLVLARAAGLAPGELRPVPLLEQLEDLEAAGPLAEAALAAEPFRAAVRGELEVMLGYSDSGKQAGYVSSNVALHRAQLALAKVASDHGVVLTVFHGRGGAVGRGGGPANRAIFAQPPEALGGRFRVTEQGETIAARFGRAEIAARELEQILGAVIVTSGPGAAPFAPERRAAFDAALASGDAAARAAYERLLEDRDRLTRYATAATPIEHIGEMRIASRPARRGGGVRFEDLRAIPWVFSWTQSRHGLPGWFGLGTALARLVAERGRDGAREMYRSWPFFRALVDNARLALVRADIAVAAEYAGLADEADRGLFELVRDEHDRTLRIVEEVTGEGLVDPWPTLLRSLRRRDPYTDVLSHAQIELLRRLRDAPDGPERERLREALFATINGIAAGLMSAG